MTLRVHFEENSRGEPEIKIDREIRLKKKYRGLNGREIIKKLRREKTIQC